MLWGLDLGVSSVVAGAFFCSAAGGAAVGRARRAQLR